MKRIGFLIGFAAILAFLLPLAAQDVKKKVDKKEADKAVDGDKNDPEKMPEKKKDEKKKKEKLVYGAKFTSKIVNIKPQSNREFTIEIQERDPKKVYDMNLWAAQRQQQLAQQYVNAVKQKDGGQAVLNWMRDSNTFQFDYAKRQTQVFTPRNIEVRATDAAKVRAMTPPIEFDDAGFQKKWTKKELEARKDKTGLPGFPVDFDAIKQGQYVEIYMAKVVPAKKDNTKKKKGPDDVDAPPMMAPPIRVRHDRHHGGPEIGTRLRRSGQEA